ncbi:MAG: tyrosine-type recombinase/integrase [Proteobacteria bacterium]|nr:tyrosine-type recombinase/integrase [Pseudomonadota bacterium]
MADYEAAMKAGDPITATSKRAHPSKALKVGSVHAAIATFYTSTDFQNWSPETQRTRRNILERFRVEHGEKMIGTLQPRHVADMVAAKSKTPAAAQNFKKTLSALMRFAILHGYRNDDPTTGVKVPRLKGDGFATWSEEHIAAFEAHHSIGSRARLAFALLLYTAQRRGDVIRMGRQHIREGLLSVRQAKTGAALQIPIHPHLQAVIDATPSNHLTFLVTAYGKPFTSAGFGNLFRDWCSEVGLPVGLSAHGLRKAACRRLAEAGCSANQIMAVSGHRSLSEAEKYVRAADQIRLARAAMAIVTQRKENL